MNIHYRTVCNGCGQVISECRTFPECRIATTVKDVHEVDHSVHVRMLSSVDVKEEESACG